MITLVQGGAIRCYLVVFSATLIDNCPYRPYIKGGS
jgi:hypothetical protein